VPNDFFIVVACGTIGLGQLSGLVDANGAGGNRTAPGTLLLRNGSRETTPICARGFVAATQGGPVNLKVQDTRYEDNTGRFAVTVIQLPASLLNAARVITLP
jgi:hypothetical protein